MDYNSEESSQKFNEKTLEYIDYFKNNLTSKENYKLLVKGMKISCILISIFTIIGLLIPPSFKKITILYLIILGQIIILSILLKKNYLSVIVDNLKDENNNTIIPIVSNLFIGIWIVFFIISINGLINHNYSIYNLILRYKYSNNQ